MDLIVEPHINFVFFESRGLKFVIGIKRGEDIYLLNDDEEVNATRLGFNINYGEDFACKYPDTTIFCNGDILTFESFPTSGIKRWV